jgi:hypothetical protein
MVPFDCGQDMGTGVAVTHMIELCVVPEGDVGPMFSKAKVEDGPPVVITSEEEPGLPLPVSGAESEPAMAVVDDEILCPPLERAMVDPEPKLVESAREFINALSEAIDMPPLLIV